MFGCYNVETKNVIDALACGAVDFGVQASPREYLTSHNLFDNELLVVTLSRTALSLATSYSNFMEQTCSGEYKLIHVNREDRAFYRNMFLFSFTGQLLERARYKGINPDIEGDRGYFGFHREDVDRYGYYFLFLRNLPRYAEKIWDLRKAQEEKELAAEAKEEGGDEETPPGTPGPAGNESIEDEWKDIKKYTFAMHDLGQLMRINIKLSVKQVSKTIPKPNKCDPSERDALPWEGVENNLNDIPIHPCVSCMWRALFTALQKLMGAVNSQSMLDPMSETLSKKDMVEALDINILHIENIRNRIERLDETCRDIVDDMNLANRDKKANIPETYITRLGQMEKELTGIDTSICSGISDLQDLRFGFVPRDTPKKSWTSGKQETKKRKRD
jgi:hypothetical protein